MYSWNQTSEQSFSMPSVSGIGDLVSNDQSVAIAAKSSSINAVWFVYVIDINCVDHLSNNIDGRLQSQ